MLSSHLPRASATVGLGALILLFSSCAIGIADAANPKAYFPDLSTDEKEQYTNWLADHYSSSYPRHTFLPSSSGDDDGAAVFWNIEGDIVHFALVVRADENGWAGFGISEAGGMLGSDMALYEASKPTPELVDSHVVDNLATPLTDAACSQDWTLKDAISEDGWMIVEMSRLLDTQDGQDVAIKEDADLWSPPTRIIAAWGDSESVSFHGDKVARSSVRLFADPANDGDDDMTDTQVVRNALDEQSDGYFDVLEDEFEIPAIETHYQDLCKTYDEIGVQDLLPEGQSMVTMIGGTPVIPEETARFIHHFLVYAQKDCSRESFRTRSLIYAWAPGNDGFALPDDVGFPLFDGTDRQALYVQIHYNNPDEIAGMRDSSGVRIYYTHDERMHQAGMLEVGDPLVGLNGQPVGDGLSKFEFTCPSACSTTFLLEKERSNGEDQGVTVISEFLHMHQTGARMTNEVIRGDGTVHHKAVSEVYDFDQQGGFHVPQDAYTVMPGDSFRTTCFYRNGTTFGEGSREEMCIAYLTYYPAKKSSTGQPWICPFNFWMDVGAGCAGELEHAELDDDDGLGRNFGVPSNDCSVTEPTPGSSEVSDDPVAEPDPETNQPPPAPEESLDTTDNSNQPPPAPEEPPEAIDDPPASGAGWHGVSLLLTCAPLLALVIFM